MIDTVGTRAWLIRHGQSESNAGMPTEGPGTAPLTQLGRTQAVQVAAAFAEPPALIVSSTFERARDTARPTRERFPDVPYEEWPVQEFTFLGSLHGPGSTNEQRRPAALAYWERCDPEYVSGGDGESFKHLVTRTVDLRERLAARPRGLVAVFTHGLYARALMWSLSTGITDPDAEAMASFRHFLSVWTIPNGAIVELRENRDDPRGFHLIGGSFTHLTAPSGPLSGTTPPGLAESG
jgi:broad specificity phosphatase PhoE